MTRGELTGPLITSGEKPSLEVVLKMNKETFGDSILRGCNYLSHHTSKVKQFGRTLTEGVKSSIDPR